MSMFEQRAVRGTRKARIALAGPSGSGKTKTALLLAEGILRTLPAGMKIALLDTEHRSSELYAEEHEFYPAYMAAPYSPQRYVKVINEAAARGDIGVFIVDSLSHAWMGKGGTLEQVDQIAGRSNDNRNAWKQMTPVQQELVETIIGAPFAVIATLRTKDAYGQDERGKRVKMGLAPVQRDGLDYEFDVAFYLDQQHTATVEKSRVTHLLPVNATIDLPGPEVSESLAEWLASGRAPAAQTPPPAAAADAGATPPATPPPAETPPQTPPSDPFAAPPEDPTPPSQPSAGQPAPTAANAGEGSPDAAPANAGTNDPFGETTNGAADPTDVLGTMRGLIDQKRRQLVSITQPADANRGDTYWVEKIAARCQEWYGKAYEQLTADELADLGQKLEQTRLALIAQRQPAGAQA